MVAERWNGPSLLVCPSVGAVDASVRPGVRLPFGLPFRPQGEVYGKGERGGTAASLKMQRRVEVLTDCPSPQKQSPKANPDSAPRSPVLEGSGLRGRPRSRKTYCSGVETGEAGEGGGEGKR